MRESCRRHIPRSTLGRGARLALAALAALALSAPPAIAARAVASAAPPPSPPSAPTNRYDLGAWLEHQHQTGSQALPEAARLFQRRGLALLRSGASEDGVRMLRGAIQLDPGFLAPRVALVQHFLGRDASQALRELAGIVDLARTHYGLQHHLVASATFFFVLAVLFATGLLALYTVWRHRGAVRHAYQDFLERRMPKRTAVAGSWLVLGLPYALGLGLFYPTLFLLGNLWGSLKRGERALFLFLTALLLVLPFGAARYATLSIPDQGSDPPFYGTVQLAHAPYSAERLTTLLALSAQHPENAMLHFAAAWMAQRGGDWALAEAEWTAARALWPNEPRIPNNLGNLALLRDHGDQAEELYREASRLDPEWAVPHYNLGQLYTRQFRYSEASEELARASAADFELVRNLQSGVTARAGDPLPVAWGWLAPRTQWDVLLQEPVPANDTVLPAAWRSWAELNGWASAVLTLAAAGVGLVLGLFGRRRLPVRPCSNCRQDVCRRCATAFRDRIYCAGCTGVKGEAAAPEFARLLLLRRRRSVQAVRRRWELVLSAVLPGYGPTAVGHAWLSWCLLALAAPWLLSGFGLHGPYSYDPRIGPLAPRAWDGGVATAFVVVQLCSVALYFLLRSDQAEAEEPAAGRRTAVRLSRAA